MTSNSPEPYSIGMERRPKGLPEPAARTIRAGIHRRRTQLDTRRDQRLRDATKVHTLNDVDSAHAIIASDLILLKTYRANYSNRAMRVRDTVLFSYQDAGVFARFPSGPAGLQGCSAKLFNLISAHLIAAAQLNLAVGREAI